MKKNKQIAIFEGKQIRRVWDEKKEKWYFSVVDIIAVLTNSGNPQVYWRVLKKRLIDEGSNETVTKCNGLKMMASDGKMRLTAVADTETILRLIQSIPSPNAEPFKRWLARIGQERGARENIEFAILTNEIMQGAFEMKVEDYKNYKGLDKENLRDHMNDIELILTMLAEATTTKLHKDRDSKGFPKLKKDAGDGGAIAGRTRKDIERTSGKKVVSRKNYLNNPNFVVENLIK